MKYLIGMLDRICAVTGALICSQIPLFIKQYTLRLGGHVTELRLHVNSLNRAADASNKTLYEYVRKFVTNSDPDIYQQGEFIQGMIDRLQELSYSLTTLENATIFSKPFIFFYSFNTSIVKDTFDSFQPGIIFSMETLVYSLIGITLGCFVFKIACRCYTFAFASRKKHAI